MILTPSFIVLFSLVFLAVWLFARTIDKRLWVSLLIGIVLAPIFYFYVFYPFINIFIDFHHEKHFNSLDWKDKPALRYEMSDEIIEDSIFVGKEKNTVQSMLGESEWYGWDDSLKMNSENKWNYNLGFKPGAFNMNQECLELNFKNEVVVEVRQYQLEKSFE